MTSKYIFLFHYVELTPSFSDHSQLERVENVFTYGDTFLEAEKELLTRLRKSGWSVNNSQWQQLPNPEFKN